MMVNTPDYIKKLMDEIDPWFEVDLELHDVHLRADAPQKIKDALKKVEKYREKHRYPLGFEE